jgi:hypothetical protein
MEVVCYHKHSSFGFSFFPQLPACTLTFPTFLTFSRQSCADVEVTLTYPRSLYQSQCEFLGGFLHTHHNARAPLVDGRRLRAHHVLPE